MLSADVASRYIYNSNKLDGITLSEEQTRELVEKGKPEPPEGEESAEEIEAPDGKEWDPEVVISHQKALERTAEFAASGEPFSQEIVLELHKILMGELLLSAGEYRECSLKYKGLLIASPPETLKDRMEALKNLLNSGMVRPEAKKDQLAWRVHHEFITIHPFIEGNGRMSRLLLNLVRLKAGLDIAIVKWEDREKYSKAIVDFQQQKIAKAQSKTGG